MESMLLANSFPLSNKRFHRKMKKGKSLIGINYNLVNLIISGCTCFFSLYLSQVLQYSQEGSK